MNRSVNIFVICRIFAFFFKRQTTLNKNLTKSHAFSMTVFFPLFAPNFVTFWLPLAPFWLPWAPFGSPFGAP